MMILCFCMPMVQNGVRGINALGLKFKNGVIVAVDTGACYGGLRLPNVQTVHHITDMCAAVFSGSLGDIQSLEKRIKEELEADELRHMDPQGIHRMVQRILYSKRSEGQPMDVSVVVAGVNPKKNSMFDATDERGRMVGCVDSKGNFWFDNSIALSFSQHLALPILREKNLDDLDRGDAIRLVEECFRILCYRDCRSTARIQISVVEKHVEILDPHVIETSWNIGLKEGEIVLDSGN